MTGKILMPFEKDDLLVDATLEQSFQSSKAKELQH